MVQFRPSEKEIVAKIVYYGPPLSGKTTNLRTLYQGYPPEVRGELVILPTGMDRTIYFDYLPITVSQLRGMTLRVQLYTVPGQVRFNSTRQIVLRGVDGVVFVADSQREMLQANRESWENLKDNLLLQGLKLAEVPHVLQYNKRDLPRVLPVEELDAALNEFNAPFFEAVAPEGIGVEDTLASVVRLTIRSLRDRFALPTEPAREAPTPAPTTPRPETQPVVVSPRTAEDHTLLSTPLPPPEVTPPTVPVGVSQESRAPIFPLPEIATEKQPPAEEGPFGARAGAAPAPLELSFPQPAAPEELAFPEASAGLQGAAEPAEGAAVAFPWPGGAQETAGPWAAPPAEVAAELKAPEIFPTPDQPFSVGESPFEVSSPLPPAEGEVFALAPPPPQEIVVGEHPLDRVVPRAVARQGELRELEVEVPVPAAWVGGQRVTLQLRLVLVPREEGND